jgi:WD40 repeat protein
LAASENKNPYVGPYAFSKDNAAFFFGRDREARHLTALAISEQVVVFCAQSGAGKTSLIHAKVVPALEKQGFYVFPPARVSGELPPSGFGTANVFVYNALAVISPKQVPGDTLDGFLMNHPAPSEGQRPPRVLIVDQFEEILTHHTERWEQREDFFLQLRKALNADSRLSIILAMRDDRVAGLDRYALILPGLRKRFQMERLRFNDAVTAIRKPAEAAGRPFAGTVAEDLALNLCQVKVADQETTVAGEFVEPVHLQIVCWQLWENLRQRPGEQITAEEARTFGDIDEALETFYDSAVEAAKASGVAEAEIRNFCGNILITPARIRSQVSLAGKLIGGLPKKAVDVLVERHLLLPEAVRGGIWYELAHDRLIDPILKSNQKWMGPGSSELSMDARAWQAANLDPNFLYRGSRLAEAIKKNQQAPLGALESEFLKAAQQTELFQKRRNTRRMWFAITVLTFGLLITGIVATLAFHEWSVAYSRERASEALLALKGLTLVDASGLQLAVDAVASARTDEAARALHEALRSPVKIWEAPVLSAFSLSLSPDGKWFAVVQNDGSVSILNAVSGKPLPTIPDKQSSPPQPTPRVTCVASSKDYLATAAGTDEEAHIDLWTAPVDGRSFRPKYLAGMKDVSNMAFSADGKYLAVAGNSPELTLWNVGSGQKMQPLVTHSGNIRTFSFSADGRYLGISGEEGGVTLWDARALKELLPLRRNGAERQDAVIKLVFSATGELATLSAGGRVKTWSIEDGQEKRTFLDASGASDAQFGASDIDFSPDGELIAVGGKDGARIFLARSGAVSSTIPKAGGGMVGVVFDLLGDGRLLTLSSTENEGSATLWIVPIAPTLYLTKPETLAFRADGALLVANTTESWIVRREPTARLPKSVDEPSWCSDVAAVSAVRFSSDGTRVACLGNGKTLEVRDSQSVRPLFGPRPLKSAVDVPVLSPDGKFVAAFSAAKLIAGPSSARNEGAIWDVASGRTVAAVEKGVTRIAFTPDSVSVAIVNEDGTIEVWALVPWHRRFPVRHGNRIFDVAFSPDGRRMATLGDDGLVKLWDAQNGHEISPKRQIGRQGVNALAFSADGNRLTTASLDGNAELWDAADGRALFDLPGHGSALTNVVCSKDGKLLALIGQDGSVDLEVLDIDWLLRLAKGKLQLVELAKRADSATKSPAARQAPSR